MKLFKNGKVSTETREKLKEKFPSLTDDDFKEDNSSKLLIHLQEELGKSKEEMRAIIRKL